MAIIYSYPKKITPISGDFLVITDSEVKAPSKNRTKSLTVGALNDFIISSSSVITGSGTVNTIPIFTGSTTIGDSFMTYDPASSFFNISKRLSIAGDLSVSGRGDFSGAYLRISCPIQDGSNVSGTAGQVLSSTGNSVQWVDAASGTVTGTGTTNTIPMWTDGPNGVLGDSPISSINSTNSLKFVDYTAIAVATTESLTPNQSNQAPTEDTLAILSVDPDGNVVRGSQEGTWTFTKAQLDNLLTIGPGLFGGAELIQAPGADKAVIVEESNWMITYSGTGSMSDNGFVVRQSSNIVNAEITRIPSGQINTIMSSAPTNPSYGFYSRDLPLYNLDGRTYKTNQPTMLVRVNTNDTPANLVSISIKLKYRLFDATTF